MKKLLSVVLALSLVLTLFAGIGITASAETSADDTSTVATSEAEINSYEEFIYNLALLEELAKEYVKLNPAKDPVALVIKYIRTGVERYNSGSWGIMAGYEDADFAEFVQQMEDAINAEVTDGNYITVTALKNINIFDLPNGDSADLGHVFGAMDITYHNKESQNHADVSGWAGDLVDLLEVSDIVGVGGDLEEMVEYISENLLGKRIADASAPSMNQQDIDGDLDAYYIMNTLLATEYESGKLTEILMTYFTEDLNNEQRAAYFMNNRLETTGTRAQLRNAVYNAYTGNKVVSTLEGTREFTSTDLSTMRRAVCYAFADYICELAGDYVDVTENPYYEVFDSSISVLAPGITQEIKYATSADNKQMVYYIATADITRSDVNVYANYNNNDPAAGWAMQRVLDQANAAQAKYGDPESEYYIPNYNVIASTNGSGYNMSTGEPSGLLVMNGVEYQGINASGFFGILKDGTAVIGTTEEYNTIYKDQVQEGIAGFGSTLVKDGKISITRTENYYSSRASRTAVGITKTGKVVLMVLDGRQEPVSCGGSMEEIAQIMLEAGCVHAINLDGGGSSTFVAKQQGEDELSVVSKPSDGAPRSVSTSLMMVSTAPSSTAFDHANLESDYRYSTIGTPVQITPVGISATGNVAELPEGYTWAVSDERWGTITDDGVFTGLRNGAVDVYLMLDDAIIGSKTMNIVTPESVYFVKSTMDAVYGSSVQLPVAAAYEGKQVAISENDVVFSMNNDAAGTIEGFAFVGTENSGVKNVKITATLATNSEISGSITVNLYKQGENTFDFDKATGGDRQLAWDRVVSNATTDDGVSYLAVDTNEDMVTSYTFAMDMTQIPIPAKLEDLVYMLPGADMENASAWNFLLQLAERVSVLTEVTPVLRFDPNFDVDYSELKIMTEYFTLTGTDFDEETNTLTLKLNWIDQTQAIDSTTANPLCLVSGIKLTPKSDANWDANKRLNAVHSGAISYNIYLRANALYSFAQKPENQETYGLMPFVNPDIPSESGAYFGDVYKEFEDSYTLVNALKNGWIAEDGGFAYYVDGVKMTGGVKEVEGYYYLFDDNGINIGQTKHTGVFYDETIGLYRYSKLGVLTSDWQMIDGEWYYFHPSNMAAKEGNYKVGNVNYDFEATGRLVSGVWVNTQNGVSYYYGPSYYTSGWQTIDGERYYFKNGVRLTGYQYVSDYNAINTRVNKWFNFGDDGICREVEDGMHVLENGKIYYMIDGISQTGLYNVDGDYYFFNGPGTIAKGECYVWETHCELPCGTYYFREDGTMIHTEIVEMDGALYYYKNGVAKQAGIVEIDGYYYFVGDYGEIATGEFYVWRGNGIVPEGTYRFDDNGRMLGIKVVDGTVVKGEVVEIDGKLYYYNTGLAKKAGMVVVDGYYYFAGNYGEIATGEYYVWKGNGIVPDGSYRFDDNGRMLGIKVVDGTVVKGEIVEIDGELYYYNTGLAKKAGMIEVGGYYYFAGNYGKIATGEFYVWKGNGIVADGTYRFDDNGRMLGIKVVDGEIIKGEIVEIDGVQYYYDTGVPKAAGIVEVDGKYYYAGKKGVITTGHIFVNGVCSDCGAVITLPATLKFKSASLSLQDNLKVKFKVEASLFADGLYENPYVVFEFMGETIIVTEYTVNGDYYDFTIAVAPNQMKQNISATLYAEYKGVLVASSEQNYSAVTYCMNQLSKTTDDDFKTLLVDMLNYGTQFQKYLQDDKAEGFTADDYINSVLTDEQKAFATSATPKLDDCTNIKYAVVENETALWRAASLHLADSVKMRMKFDLVDGVTIDNVTVKVETETGDVWYFTAADTDNIKLVEGYTNRYYLYVDTLMGFQMREKVWFTIYEGDTAISNTVQYSIESYAERKQDVTTNGLNEMVIAMMKYGDSAYKYCY